MQRFVHDFRESHGSIGTRFEVCLTPAENNIIGLHAQFARCYFGELLTRIFGGGLDRIASHEGPALRECAPVKRHDIGITLHDADIFRLSAQHFRRYHAHHRVRALPHIGYAGKQCDNPIVSNLDHCG